MNGRLSRGIFPVRSLTNERSQFRHEVFGHVRRKNSSNRGTEKAVSPWRGLQIRPLPMSWLRVRPSAVTGRFKAAAMSPER